MVGALCAWRRGIGKPPDLAHTALQYPVSGHLLSTLISFLVLFLGVLGIPEGRGVRSVRPSCSLWALALAQTRVYMGLEWNGLTGPPRAPTHSTGHLGPPALLSLSPSLVTQPFTISGVPIRTRKDVSAQEGSRTHLRHHLL